MEMLLPSVAKYGNFNQHTPHIWISQSSLNNSTKNLDDQSTKRPEFLIKIPRSGITELFREVNTILYLGPHPYIVPLLDLVEWPSLQPPSAFDLEKFKNPFLRTAMVFPKGKCDLSQFIKSDQWLEMKDEEFRRHLYIITLAIQYLHQKNVVHHDIKPENFIYFEEDQTFRLIDFGLSQHIEETSIDYDEVYTLYYRPLEELKRQKSPSFFSGDIWALGCLLYEFYTGDQLFSGNNTQEIIGSIEKFFQDDISKVPFPIPLKQLFLRMITPDPQNRITIVGIVDDPYFSGLQPNLENQLKVVNKFPDVKYDKLLMHSFADENALRFEFLLSNYLLRFGNTMPFINTETNKVEHIVISETTLNSARKIASSMKIRYSDNALLTVPLFLAFICLEFHEQGGEIFIENGLWTSSLESFHQLAFFVWRCELNFLIPI